MRGCGPDRLLYASRLMQDCDLLLLQEHWLLDDTLHKLVNSDPDLIVYGKSGMETDRLLGGRPYGGCALIHRRQLRCAVTPIAVTSRRLFACMVNFVDFPKMLLFNVYMPCDSNNADGNDLFREILSDIESIMSLNEDIDHVIIGGDLNSDVSRLRSSHAGQVTDFCSHNGLRLCLDSAHNSVDFTYENEASRATSTIDHFIVSENLFECIDSYFTMSEGDNCSDHNPLFLHLSVRVEHLPTFNPDVVQRSFKSLWEKASDREQIPSKH